MGKYTIDQVESAMRASVEVGYYGLSDDEKAILDWYESSGQPYADVIA